MDSNITINIVEPGSPTPAPVVPNTGLFTSSIGGPEATVIVSIGLFLIIATVLIVYLLHKKKVGRVTALQGDPHTSGYGGKQSWQDPSKETKKTKVSAGLVALALLVSAGAFTALALNSNESNTNAKEGEELLETESSPRTLTLDVNSKDLTIEVADEPVFAVLPVELTVEEATEAGYTLTAYTDNTDLVSTTDSSKVIPMVTLPEAGGELSPLTDNTYGLALEEPTTKDEAVYTSLSIDPEEPTILKSMPEYTPTEENDKTTIYYGFYITPDTPYGTYTGSTISYEAIPNLATISYNAAGLYYNNDESFTTNTVGYKPSTPDSPIEELTGEYLTPAPLNPDSSSSPIHYTFLGWSKTEGATTPDYEDEEDIIASLSLSPNEDLTLYAVWHYDTVLSFNGTTSDGGEAIEQQTIAAGTTITLPHNTYTRTGSVFTGWNTVETPTPDNPGKDYKDEANFTAPDSSADITLYAQWAATTISFDGNTSESGTMNPITIAGGTSTTLPQNAYTKSHCTFTSWNTKLDGTGTRYPGEAQYEASLAGVYSFTLYTQWQCESMINFNGNGETSGYMPGIMATGGQQTTLPPNTFVRDGYSFNGWNTKADGTGESYSDQGTYIAPVSESQNITLYAQWAATTITFSGNGATSGSMDQFNVPAGTTANLPQNTFTRTSYVFNGWNTSPDGTGTSYSDQSSYYATAGVNTSVTLHAQWLPTTTITFNGNGETSGSMSPQAIVAGTPQNLTPNAFAKEGYIFNGWNTNAEGTGTAYADKAQYTASTIAAENVTLYAQWKQVFYMQDVATWGSTLSQGSTMEAVDKRDGQVYTVARLADNKIWMTKNLNLAGGTEITSELSNVPDGYTLPTANGFQSGNKLPASSTSGFNDSTKAFVYNSTKTSGTDCASPGCYSYYSWTAATAGSGLSIDKDNTDAPYSICPKGWKLPNSRIIVADKSDFYQLAVAYGMNPSSTSQSTANFVSQAGPDTTPNFLLAGRYRNGYFGNGGSVGLYWSSTSYDSAEARYLNFSSSRVHSADRYDRRDGYAVRCIAE